MKKLIPRIMGGGGGCPILIFGIGANLFVEDVPLTEIPPSNNPTDESDDDEIER